MAGDTSGQGITAFGGGWFALTASGSQVTATARGSGGGNGYCAPARLPRLQEELLRARGRGPRGRRERVVAVRGRRVRKLPIAAEPVMDRAGVRA